VLEWADCDPGPFDRRLGELLSVLPRGAAGNMHRRKARNGCVA
jgi:hypothetical protein